MEDNHATRRLGSTNHTESGDEIMCSMPEKTSCNESSTPDGEAEAQGFLLRNSTLIGSAFAASYVTFIIVYLLASRMWDEDEIRLHILNSLVRIFQALARLFGSWALEFEQTYNEYVNALH